MAQIQLLGPRLGCAVNLCELSGCVAQLLRCPPAPKFLPRTLSFRTMSYSRTLYNRLSFRDLNHTARQLNVQGTGHPQSYSSFARVLSLRSVIGPGNGASHSQPLCCKRFISAGSGQPDKRKTTIVIYICAVGIFMVGATYAGVPLYRIFCQATGLGGQAVKGHDINKVEKMVPIAERVLKIRFNADVASSMQWNFRPQQTEVKVVPGETALAFYTAKNPTSKPIIGISTYNVVPFEAGQYFNKIQCFCFEEQRLNSNEQVDMPVFFFIDPEFAEDPKCAQIETITLSYTFFEAKEGLVLPYPGYATGVYARSAS